MMNSQDEETYDSCLSGITWMMSPFYVCVVPLGSSVLHLSLCGANSRQHSKCGVADVFWRSKSVCILGKRVTLRRRQKYIKTKETISAENDKLRFELDGMKSDKAEGEERIRAEMRLQAELQVRV